MKVQTTIALSALVGKGVKVWEMCTYDRTIEHTNNYNQDDSNLGDALRMIASLAAAEKSEDASFAEQVSSVCTGLFTILRDSAAISRHSGDPETTADLLFRIASSYATTPDLRVSFASPHLAFPVLIFSVLGDVADQFG